MWGRRKENHPKKFFSVEDTKQIQAAQARCDRMLAELKLQNDITAIVNQTERKLRQKEQLEEANRQWQIGYEIGKRDMLKLIENAVLDKLHTIHSN